MRPLVCTTNTLCHVDYGIPISAYKSTDYRTCTGTYHRFMPPLPESFDCRVHVDVNRKLQQNTSTQKDEHFKTIYNKEYYIKQGDGNVANYLPKPKDYQCVNYLRNVQEKLFSNPPPPREFTTSTTKSDFCGAYPELHQREVFPPNPYAYCEIKALGRDECPPVPPEQPGYYRLMDPYMTTARISYIPFTLSQQDGIGRKDIITFYDASDIPRAGKGYGPRNGPAIEPIYQSPNYDMYDRIVFKTKHQGKAVPRGMKKLPHSGSTEYRSNYKLQTYYDCYPMMNTPLEDWDESLPKASVWQDLAPPGMYCTDYCHIGKGWPVRAVIDPNLPVDYKFRDVKKCAVDTAETVQCVDV